MPLNTQEERQTLRAYLVKELKHVELVDNPAILHCKLENDKKAKLMYQITIAIREDIDSNDIPFFIEQYGIGHIKKEDITITNVSKRYFSFILLYDDINEEKSKLVNLIKAVSDKNHLSSKTNIGYPFGSNYQSIKVHDSAFIHNPTNATQNEKSIPGQSSYPFGSSLKSYGRPVLGGILVAGALIASVNLLPSSISTAAYFSFLFIGISAGAAVIPASAGVVLGIALIVAAGLYFYRNRNDQNTFAYTMLRVWSHKMGFSRGPEIVARESGSNSRSLFASKSTS